jgi:hypothetical protein
MLIYKGFNKIMAIQITMPATFKPDYGIRITGPGSLGKKMPTKK